MTCTEMVSDMCVSRLGKAALAWSLQGEPSPCAWVIHSGCNRTRDSGNGWLAASEILDPA
eukprot:644005-Amphidinium_carterae.1